MATKQELEERMRLYEMYSTAVLAGFSSIDSNWSRDTMLKEVDKTTKEMIEYHFIYSQGPEDE